MKWTDEQIEIVLFTISEADEGCLFCVAKCLHTFWDLNKYDENLLNKFKNYFLKHKEDFYFDWENIFEEIKELKKMEEE